MPFIAADFGGSWKNHWLLSSAIRTVQPNEQNRPHIFRYAAGQEANPAL